MAVQVAATVLKIGQAPLLAVAQDWSFPTENIAMAEVVDGNINASITWNGLIYYVSETLAELEEAANAGGGGSSYLVYTALLSQSGTNAPVATVLENTLGGTVVWSYDDVGSYRATLTGAFTANKTVIFIPSAYYDNICYGQYGNANEFYVLTAFIDGDGAHLENGQLFVTAIEIRVYP